MTADMMDLVDNGVKGLGGLVTGESLEEKKLLTARMCLGRE